MTNILDSVHRYERFLKLFKTTFMNHTRVQLKDFSERTQMMLLIKISTWKYTSSYEQHRFAMSGYKKK